MALEEQSLHILVSNDDGIQADGIIALVKSLAREHKVTVVAPDRQQSATSHSMSLYRTLYITEVEFPVPGVDAYQVTGTPVDCVKWAMAQLRDVQGKRFDLMVSGINAGWNLATDVLYSGTVAAAGEAALQQTKAIAISLAGRRTFDFDAAASTVYPFIAAAAEWVLPPDTFLSVNLPEGALGGCRWYCTRLGVRRYQNEFRTVPQPDGTIGYRYGGEILDELDREDTDLSVIRKGHISVTPLQYHFTNDAFLDSLKETMKSLV